MPRRTAISLLALPAATCRGELQFAVWPWAEAHGSTLKRAPRPRSGCHCFVRASIVLKATYLSASLRPAPRLSKFIIALNTRK